MGLFGNSDQRYYCSVDDSLVRCVDFPHAELPPTPLFVDRDSEGRDLFFGVRRS
jgi:hypothetical protein